MGVIMSNQLIYILGQQLGSSLSGVRSFAFVYRLPINGITFKSLLFLFFFTEWTRVKNKKIDQYLTILHIGLEYVEKLVDILFDLSQVVMSDEL